MEDKIILYSTGCPRCDVLKKKLDAKMVAYMENNSVEDMTRLGITMVPVLEVNGVKMDFKESVNWINQK